MSEALVVLARAPIAGEGKSRLRRALAAHRGALVDLLVHAMVEDTLAWAARLGRPVVVAGDGDPATLRRLAPAARHVRQPRAAFGARIEHALAAGFGGGGRRVVQVGTDSPTLPGPLLEEAFATLAEGHDAVVIPAEDGGWVALGLSRPPGGELARAPVRWSTEHAAADTIAALRAAGRRVRVLEPWYDIDGPDGLERLAADRQAPGRAPRSLAALQALAAGEGTAA